MTTTTTQVQPRTLDQKIAARVNMPDGTRVRIAEMRGAAIDRFAYLPANMRRVGAEGTLQGFDQIDDERTWYVEMTENGLTRSFWATDVEPVTDEPAPHVGQYVYTPDTQPRDVRIGRVDAADLPVPVRVTQTLPPHRENAGTHPWNGQTGSLVGIDRNDESLTFRVEREAPYGTLWVYDVEVLTPESMERKVDLANLPANLRRRLPDGTNEATAHLDVTSCSSILLTVDSMQGWPTTNESQVPERLNGQRGWWVERADFEPYLIAAPHVGHPDPIPMDEVRTLLADVDDEVRRLHGEALTRVTDLIASTDRLETEIAAERQRWQARRLEIQRIASEHANEAGWCPVFTNGMAEFGLERENEPEEREYETAWRTTVTISTSIEVADSTVIDAVRDEMGIGYAEEGYNSIEVDGSATAEVTITLEVSGLHTYEDTEERCVCEWIDDDTIDVYLPEWAQGMSFEYDTIYCDND